MMKDTIKPNGFQHAIEILEERECQLRAHARKCRENEDEIMYGPIGNPETPVRLQELRDAIRYLRANSTSALPSTQQAR